MASNESVVLNDPHPPQANAIEAFTTVLPAIKSAILKSRHDWDKHEPAMWSRARGLTDNELTGFDLTHDLVEVRSAPTSYGTIVFGKLRIPAIKDNEGEGFIHVRIHDPPNRGKQDIIFHSIFTDEGNRDKDGKPTTWNAVQKRDTPLEFFSE